MVEGSKQSGPGLEEADEDSVVGEGVTLGEELVIVPKDIRLEVRTNWRLNVCVW